MFADDCKMSLFIHDQQIKHTHSYDLDNIQTWTDKWRVTFMFHIAVTYDKGV